jgi:hypothetical protein
LRSLATTLKHQTTYTKSLLATWSSTSHAQVTDHPKQRSPVTKSSIWISPRTTTTSAPQHSRCPRLTAAASTSLAIHYLPAEDRLQAISLFDVTESHLTSDLKTFDRALDEHCNNFMAPHETNHRIWWGGSWWPEFPPPLPLGQHTMYGKRVRPKTLPPMDWDQFFAWSRLQWVSDHKPKDRQSLSASSPARRAPIVLVITGHGTVTRPALEFGFAFVLFINKEFTVLRFCCVWDGVRVFLSKLSSSQLPGSTGQKHGRDDDNGFRLRGVWFARKAFLRVLVLVTCFWFGFDIWRFGSKLRFSRVCVQSACDQGWKTSGLFVAQSKSASFVEFWISLFAVWVNLSILTMLTCSQQVEQLR